MIWILLLFRRQANPGTAAKDSPPSCDSGDGHASRFGFERKLDCEGGAAARAVALRQQLASEFFGRQGSAMESEAVAIFGLPSDLPPQQKDPGQGRSH